MKVNAEKNPVIHLSTQAAQEIRDQARGRLGALLLSALG